ncbi:MAG: hypothetical protein Q9175_007861 [Cornicularia normoerica]
MKPYTPISDPDEPGHFDRLVKRYPDGKMSDHLHSFLPGQTLPLKTGPMLTHDRTPNKHPQIALIAGGAGITPMYQLTRAVLKNQEDKTKVALILGVNSDADVIFELDFRELERTFPDRFKAAYTVSNPTRESRVSKDPSSRYEFCFMRRRVIDRTFGLLMMCFDGSLPYA